MITWNQIASELARSGPHALARVPAQAMQHPRDGGLAQTFGLPYGQRASYRAQLADGGTLCVEDFGSVYEARIEPKSQPSSPGSTPAGTVLGLTAFGALLGLALGGRKETALTGALLGGASGLASVALTEAERSPATSAVAVDLTKAIVSLLPAVAATPAKHTSPLAVRGLQREHRAKK